MLVFNVRLHGDSENDHKNANRLQSEAFQKRIGNGLRVNAKNGKTLLVIANGHVTIAFPCHFCGVYTNGVQRRKVLKILTTYRDHALLHFCLGSRLARRILRFIAPKTEDAAQCY